MPWRHALRDLALLVFTLAVWQLDARLRAQTGSAGVAAGGVAVTAGTLFAVCSYLAHEWGHLAGARLGASRVHLPDRTFSLFLFRFDSDRNTREQFLAMSCGGFLASGAAIALLFAWLPLEALSGRVALTLSLAGVAATAILELPPAWRVLRGAPIPRGVAYHSAPGAPGMAQATPGPVLHLDHLAEPTFDSAATCRFYTEVLGMRLVEAIQGTSDAWGGRRFLHTLFALESGEMIGFFEIEGLARPAAARPPEGVRHVALRVESQAALEAWRRHLEARGVAVSFEDHGDHRSLYLTDPNGVGLELTHRSRSPDEDDARRARECVRAWASAAR